MLYKDGNGFPLTLKPSHLFGSTERMDVAEVLSAIVEQACLYTPETAVGVQNVKRPKALSEEALTKDVKVPKEALKIEKFPVGSGASNLVRLKLFELACLLTWFVGYGIYMKRKFRRPFD